MIWLITLWLFFSPTVIHHQKFHPDSLIVWNVGQGQWVTKTTLSSCYHFDAGGERFPMEKIKELCRDKDNELFISHWDLDHIVGLKFLKFWPQICRRNDPIGEASKDKRKLLEHFKFCKKPLGAETEIQKIYPLENDHPSEKVSSNELSAVYIVDHWLLSGDSTEKEEKIWNRRWGKKKIKGFVLGHHGSKTSNSEELIQALPGLRYSVASARWRRYKHPHPKIIKMLSKYRKRILRTEDWGNLHFQIQ